MANSRIRRVSTLQEFERALDDFITMGYKVVSRGNNNAHLVKYGEKTQHGLVALLTIWWTFGLGNLIYALLPAKVEDDISLRVEN